MNTNIQEVWILIAYGNVEVLDKNIKPPLVTNQEENRTHWNRAKQPPMCQVKKVEGSCLQVSSWSLLHLELVSLMAAAGFSEKVRLEGVDSVQRTFTINLTDSSSSAWLCLHTQIDGDNGDQIGSNWLFHSQSGFYFRICAHSNLPPKFLSQKNVGTIYTIH